MLLSKRSMLLKKPNRLFWDPCPFFRAVGACVSREIVREMGYDGASNPEPCVTLTLTFSNPLTFSMTFSSSSRSSSMASHTHDIRIMTKHDIKRYDKA